MDDNKKEAEKFFNSVKFLGWSFTENYRNRMVFDLLKILKSNSKSKFLCRVNYYICANSLNVSEKVEVVLKQLNTTEGEEFRKLANSFISGLMCVACKK